MSVEQNEGAEPGKQSKRKAAPSVPQHQIPPGFEEQAARIFRERLISARRLNRLDQKDAAKRLGYRNSAPLSKIEGGQAKMPRGFLMKAALTYNVSADFLLGLSTEPERDPRTAAEQRIDASVRDELREHTRIFMTLALERVHQDFDARRLLERMVERTRRVIASLRELEQTQPGKPSYAVKLDMHAMHVELLSDLLGAAETELARRRQYVDVDPSDAQTALNLDG